MNYKQFTLELLDHDSIRLITTNSVTQYVYVDPFHLESDVALPKATIILITHPHYDHCSIEDIQKISTPETIIVTVPDALSKLAGIPAKKIELLRPEKICVINDIKIIAVAAYNTDKPFHPQENEWLGYIIEQDNVRIYVAGDTDVIPEMTSFKNIDIAFLPVSGTYVMTAEEAAEAAQIIKPKIAIPMHYGSVVGSVADAEKFKTVLEGKVKVEIIKKIKNDLPA